MNFEFTILDERSCARIHAAAKRVLSTAGMKVYDDDLCNVLARAGLIVDAMAQHVRFPPEAVEAALGAAPRGFCLADHTGTEIPLRRGTPLPAVYSNAIKVWDWETGMVRSSTLADLTQCVQLGDALPDVRVMCPVCLPSDLPQQVQMSRAVNVVFSHSRKLTMSAPQDGMEARFWLQACAVADQDLRSSDRGRGHPPTMIFVVSPTSPLQVDPETCEVMRLGVRQGIPLLISSCPMAGATSPFTMAGTTVQTHAEFLGMLTMAQMMGEGIPVIYGGSAGPMDLRVGTLSYGAAERHTMLCANIDIADHLGLPHFSSAGTVDSVFPDFQSGQAKVLAWMTRLMKGTILGIWFGSLLTGQAVAAEQIVLDTDTWKAVRSMLEGMRLDEERMAVEAICRVGPGGSFLLDEHTLRWMRGCPSEMERGSPMVDTIGEYYASPLLNHEGETGRSMVDRARERVRSILAEKASPVPERVQVDLHHLLQEQERRVGAGA